MQTVWAFGWIPFHPIHLIRHQLSATLNKLMITFLLFYVVTFIHILNITQHPTNILLMPLTFSEVTLVQSTVITGNSVKTFTMHLLYYQRL